MIQDCLTISDLEALNIANLFDYPVETFDFPTHIPLPLMVIRELK